MHRKLHFSLPAFVYDVTGPGLLELLSTVGLVTVFVANFTYIFVLNLLSQPLESTSEEESRTFFELLIRGQ